MEDDILTVHFLKSCLKEICETSIVTNAEEAIQLCADRSFDIILMDINLGAGMDGISAVQVLRKMEKYNNIPIVAMTSYATYTDEAEFLSKGCTHFIAKPIIRKEFLDKFAQIIN